MKCSWRVGNRPVNQWLNFGGVPDHRLDTGIAFWIRHYWEIRKVVSRDCAARRCRAGHALPGISLATMTSLRHQPTADSHERRAMADVCTVSVLLVGRYRIVACMSVLSITLVYCGQTVGWLRMPLSTEVGLGPGDSVLDGDPTPPHGKGYSSPPHFPNHTHCGQTVARLSNC